MCVCIVTTENETLSIDPDKVIKMVPCGSGDYNVFVEGQGAGRLMFTISGREAEKLAGDRISS